MRSRLRNGEELETVVRRHWIVLLGPAVVILFLLGCLAAVRLAGRPKLLPAVGAVVLVAALWGLWRFLDWRCDLWAVTGRRVIDESGVLAVRMVDSPIETIHNITCEQSLLGRVLGYGTVNIQTAAEHGSVTIRYASAPAELRETIIELKQRRTRPPEVAGTGTGGVDGPLPDTRECPYCAERVKIRARICRFCGRDLV